MKNHRSTRSTDPVTTALMNLSAAEVTFTEVPRCPHPDCATCRPVGLAPAA
jgi:hypothetical protein